MASCGRGEITRLKTAEYVKAQMAKLEACKRRKSTPVDSANVKGQDGELRALKEKLDECEQEVEQSEAKVKRLQVNLEDRADRIEDLESKLRHAEITLRQTQGHFVAK